MTRPTKARVRQSFERAAPTYDSAASVQRQICHELANRMADRLPALPAVTRLLDAGCGTGYAQALLQTRFPAAHAVALDLSAGMLQRIAAPCCRLAGDLEHLPLADASIDLYWSSLAVQWCDLAKTLAEARRVLKPGGQLALASLGPATFHELRTAFADVDDYHHTLNFHTPEETTQIATAAGLVAVDVQKGTETAHYADFKTLLKAVKAIGANQLGSGRRTSLMSRTDFQRAETAIEALRTPAGLPLSYDVTYLIARK
jgi:malonyl-CoA O-methyltransferase